MGERATVNGIDTWYEVWGDGDALVYLHGGIATVETGAGQTDVLAERFRVYAPERYGHGRTPDVEGPWSYDTMADQMIAFLREVVGGPAHLVGWSDGGNVGLLIALREPDLVRKVVTMGANYRFDGVMPQMFAEPMDPAGDSLAALREAYESISPDGPDHWPDLIGKFEAMVAAQPTLTVEDLARIQAPTLVMVGDDDLPTLEHTVSLYESLPKGQLAVVPGASHTAPLEKPALVNQLILEFLEGGEPETYLPLRRAGAH